MQRHTIKLSKRSGDWKLRSIAIYNRTVDFATVYNGGYVGADVSIPSAQMGDVVVGVAVNASVEDGFRVQGNISAAGTVRLTALYDGSVTDGVDAVSTNCNIAILHVEG
jgi:hypothetical protein